MKKKKCKYYIARKENVSKRMFFYEEQINEKNLQNIDVEVIKKHRIKFCRFIPDTYFNTPLIDFNENLLIDFKSLNHLIDSFINEYAEDDIVSFYDVDFLREQALIDNFLIFKYENEKFSLITKNQLEKNIDKNIEKNTNIKNMNYNDPYVERVIADHNFVFLNQIRNSLNTFSECEISFNDGYILNARIKNKELLFDDADFINKISDKALMLLYEGLDYSFTLKIKTLSKFNDDYYYEIYGYLVNIPFNEENPNENAKFTFNNIHCEVLQTNFMNLEKHKDNYVYCDICDNKAF